MRQTSRMTRKITKMDNSNGQIWAQHVCPKPSRASPLTTKHHRLWTEHPSWPLPWFAACPVSFLLQSNQMPSYFAKGLRLFISLLAQIIPLPGQWFLLVFIQILFLQHSVKNEPSSVRLSLWALQTQPGPGFHYLICMVIEFSLPTAGLRLPRHWSLATGV